MEDRGRKRGEEESEGGSDSEEESYKSEEIPSEDACTHCCLPNHPELVSVRSRECLQIQRCLDAAPGSALVLMT